MNNINAIKFISEGVSIISLDKEGEPSSVSLEYSYDGANWNTWNLCSLKINSGDTLYIRGYNTKGFSSDPLAYYKFIIEGDDVSCSGNIMSLIDYKNLPDVIPCSYCFYGLFENCNALTTAPELPATELTDCCYSYMFYGCSSLTTAPELPATTLAEQCYGCMFSGCSSLTTAPELPATTLAEYCYSYMFSECISLKIAPELPATTLADSCYYRMFNNCTSLKTVPELPVKTMTDFCYSYMFSGCSGLTTAPNELADNNYPTFQGCTMLKDNKWTEF